MSIYCDKTKCVYNELGECFLDHVASAGKCSYPGCVYFAPRIN